MSKMSSGTGHRNAVRGGITWQTQEKALCFIALRLESATLKIQDLEL